MTDNLLYKFSTAALLHNMGTLGRLSLPPQPPIEPKQAASIPMAGAPSTTSSANVYAQIKDAAHGWLRENFDEIVSIASLSPLRETKEQQLLAEAIALASGTANYTPANETNLAHNSGEQRLAAIASRLQIAGKRAPDMSFHRAAIWRDDHEILFPNPPTAVTPIDYPVLWNELLIRLRNNQLSDPWQYLAQAIHDIEATMWCVPSPGQLTDVSVLDISLATAAIAACLYQTRNESTESPFLLVSGDFTGIQNYLYDLYPGAGGYAKALRARSFFVGQCGYQIALELLRRLELPLTQLIMSAGGHFYLLLPNNEASQKAFADVAAKQERWSLAKTNGELKFCMAAVPLTRIQITRFGDAVTEVNHQLELAKSRPFVRSVISTNGWNPDAFLPNAMTKKDGEELCERCRRNFAHAQHDRFGEETEDKYICSACDNERERGEQLIRANCVALMVSEKTSTEYPFFSVAFPTDFHRDSPLLTVVWKSDTSAKPPLVRRLRAKHVPMKMPEGTANPASATPLEFGDIADKATGAPLLGFLKADVDNLGFIFQNGFTDPNTPQDSEEFYRQHSLSRVATLSRMLEGFFGGYVDQLVEQEFPDIYLVYSGGDDLAAVGPWDKTIQFAIKLREEFGRFTGSNPAFGFSAGIALAKPGLPLLQAIEQADHALESSKHRLDRDGNLVKDAITLFGQVLPWDVAQRALDRGKRLTGLLQDDLLHTGQIRRLLRFGRMFDLYRRSNRHDTNQLKYIPLLAYELKRNWSKLAIDNPVYAWAQNLLNPGYVEMPALSTACQYALYSVRKKGNSDE